MHVSLLLQSAIGWAFAISLASKVFSVSRFRRFVATITAFRILDARSSMPTAAALVGVEILIIALLLRRPGTWTTSIGLVAGIALLLAYSVALLSVLGRRLRIGCNCFGSSTDLVSGYDVARNGLLISCGVGALLVGRHASGPLLFWPSLLSAAMGLALVVVVINARTLVETLLGSYSLDSPRVRDDHLSGAAHG